MDGQKLSTMEVRKNNRNLIYQYLFRQYGRKICKQDIADALNLSLPTVSQNLNAFKEEGLIEENGVFASTGGRKARAFSIRPDARYSAGIDITRNHASVVIVDLRGSIVAENRTRIRFQVAPPYFRKVAAMMQDLLRLHRIPDELLLGIGISLPAIVSADGKCLTYDVLLDRTNGSVEDFERHLPYACRLFNDASTGMFAEIWKAHRVLGEHWHNDCLAYLSLNRNVGGGLMINGELVPGVNQRAGEYGHISLDPNGKQCYCGQRGCVDAYLAAHVLAEPYGGVLETFFQKLESREAEQEKIWDEYLDHLARTLNILRMCFDCDVVIGGAVADYLEPYLEELRGRASRLSPFDGNGGYIYISRLKKEAPAVGGALMYVDQFVQSV